MSGQPEADFKQWDLVDPLSVANAAWLWVGREPEPENKVSGPPALAVHKRLKNWIDQHAILGRDAAGQPVVAKGAHRLSRDLYKHIAEEWNKRPAFLFPEERKPRRRRAAGEPKKETVEGWKEHYDAVEHWRTTLDCNIREAAKRAARNAERPWTAIERGCRHYRTYLKRQNGKK